MEDRKKMQEEFSITSEKETNETEDQIVELREAFIKHFSKLGLPALNGELNNGHLTKEAIRNSHSYQRQENFQKENKAIAPFVNKIIYNFANGKEIVPSKIEPELIPVLSTDAEASRLFRFACLLWSIPVSVGYGRRIRYLVKDKYNNKLIGIFALGDPVFNLKVRDELIGWNQADRRKRLVNIMDAYVVGAVPPYNHLLGGKLIASLMCSKEVNDQFYNKYKDSLGVISNIKKAPKLALITVTSALGKSSLYNRLKLVNKEETIVEFKKIGETQGFGHFQIPDDLFEKLRDLLNQEDHPYANGHQFSQGPNWKMRVTRVGLDRIGLDANLVHHGIKREVYASPLASNYKEYLLGLETEPIIHLSSVNKISEAAKERWILPRSISNVIWKDFIRESLLTQLLFE